MKPTFYITALLAASLVGCSPSEKVPTVGDYLHDIDRAEEFAKVIKNNPAKYKSDPAAINAMTAIGAYPELLNCWPDNNTGIADVRTATTNHACLDALG